MFHREPFAGVPVLGGRPRWGFPSRVGSMAGWPTGQLVVSAGCSADGMNQSQENSRLSYVLCFFAKDLDEINERVELWQKPRQHWCHQSPPRWWTSAALTARNMAQNLRTGPRRFFSAFLRSFIWKCSTCYAHIYHFQPQGRIGYTGAIQEKGIWLRSQLIIIRNQYSWSLASIYRHYPVSTIIYMLLIHWMSLTSVNQH